MAVPRNRMSNSRKNTRRSHHALKAKSLSRCPNCSAVRMPHSLCQACGQYNSREVIAAKEAE